MATTQGLPNEAAAVTKAPHLGVEEGGEETSETTRDAMLKAALAGSRVLDLSQSNEFEQVFANPDGSWTSESSTAPEHARGPDGVLRPIDLTLVESEGEIRPANAFVDLEVSAGGHSPFVTMGAGDEAIAFDWGSRLPKPELNAETATYRDAVPGGDLVVTATATGFTHFVVLREAPATPPVYNIPIDAGSAQVTQNSRGALTIADGSDVLAFAQQPLMWDDSPKPAEVLEAEVQRDDNGTTLLLTPDFDYLTSPETSYPVIIDPTFTAYPDGDTWIATGTASQHSDPVLRVGTENSGTTRHRSFLKFAGSTWAGRSITSATLKLRNFSSPTCTPGEVRVTRLAEPWAVNTISWANQPTASAQDRASFQAAHGGPTCAVNDASFDVSGIVQGWATGSYPNHGVRVAAGDETRNASFRRYRSAEATDLRPRLSVTYNSYPAKPNWVTFSDAQPVNGAWHVRSTVPTFNAIVSDPDPGASAIEVEIRDTAGTVVVPFSQGRGSFVADGQRSYFKVPGGTLIDGGTYAVRMRTTDGHLSSALSGVPNITIDLNLSQPLSITSATYPTNGLWNGAAGQAGVFSITANTSQTHTVRFWMNDGNPSAAVVSGQSLNVTLSPSRTGRNTLFVESMNAEGAASNPVAYEFNVGNLAGTKTTAFVDEVVQTHFNNYLRQNVNPAESDIPDMAETEGLSEAEIASLDSMADPEPTGFQLQDDPVVDETWESGSGETLILPETSAGSITHVRPDGSPESSISMPSAAQDSAASLADSQLIIYPNTGVDTDTIVDRRDVDSVETYHLLRSPYAPTSFAYGPSLAPGQTILVNADQNLASVIDPDGNIALQVEAPYAVDAVGKNLPLKLANEGGQLHVYLADFVAGEVQYPILVDPVVTAGFAKRSGSTAAYCAGISRALICAIAFKLSKDATKAYKGYGAPTHRGWADAGRHCIWNASMAIQIGQGHAYEIATRHESSSRANDRAMDLHNNSAGRKLGGVISRKHDDWSAGKQKKSAGNECMKFAYIGAAKKLKMQGSWGCPVTSWANYTDNTPLYDSRVQATCVSQG